MHETLAPKLSIYLDSKTEYANAALPKCRGSLAGNLLIKTTTVNRYWGKWWNHSTVEWTSYFIAIPGARRRYRSLGGTKGLSSCPATITLHAEGSLELITNGSMWHTTNRFRMHRRLINNFDCILRTDVMIPWRSGVEIPSFRRGARLRQPIVAYQPHIKIWASYIRPIHSCSVDIRESDKNFISIISICYTW